MATIIVTWTPGGGANVVSQTVKRSISGANSYSTLATVGAAVSTYTDTTAANNTLYQYQIITNCSVGGPTVNLGGFPESIYIDCGSSDISTSIGYAGSVAYPQITWTIFNRTGTDTKTYTWQWKDASNNAISYLNTVNTQSAVSGIFNVNDFTGNGLDWNTTYVLHVVFRSTNNTYSRTCTFSITTPAQPVCAAATNLTGSNEYTVDFSYGGGV